MFLTPDSTSDAITGSSGGRPAFCACLASQRASSACEALSPGYSAAACVRSIEADRSAAAGAGAAAEDTASGGGGAVATAPGGGAAAAADAAGRLTCEGSIAFRNITDWLRFFFVSCLTIAWKSWLSLRRTSAASRATRAWALATTVASKGGAAAGCTPAGGARGGGGGGLPRGAGDQGRPGAHHPGPAVRQRPPAGELLGVVGL